MKYKMLLFLSLALLLFSPVLAEEGEAIPIDDPQEQIVIETPLLTYGMTGDDVTRLQQKLQRGLTQVALIRADGTGRQFVHFTQFTLLHTAFLAQLAQTISKRTSCHTDTNLQPISGS